MTSKYIKTFNLNDETMDMLIKLQAIDGFNASYLVRQAIKQEYELQLGLGTIHVV